jgi:hypothetical protein
MTRAAPTRGPLSACLVGRHRRGSVPARRLAGLHEWVRGVVDRRSDQRRETRPVDADRGFGPGLRSRTIAGTAPRAVPTASSSGLDPFEDGTVRFVWYLDLQTLAPLYYAAYRKSGDAAGVGYFVSRWSEDRPDYPHWSDDPARPVRVLDPIGEAMVDWNDQHAVRAEQGRTVAVPTDETKLRRNLSVGSVRLH